MKYEDSHLSDQQLLLGLEGELSSQDAKLVRTHIEACWKCRARCHELEQAITGFVQVYRNELDKELPPVAAPRALLRARIAQLSAAGSDPALNWSSLVRPVLSAAAICIVVALGLVLIRLSIERRNHSSAQSEIVSIPDSRLTPGATLLVNQPAVCAQPGARNKAVPAALQRQVFEEYGIPGADPRAYEVDYLVTPALGGADDIHNLWPHSYSSTVWNAQVKDELEDLLREMVCGGNLDLSEAQREIATNWIAAYKKYFHTDQPLKQHVR